MQYVSATHRAKDLAYPGKAVIRATNTMSGMGSALAACAVKAGQKPTWNLPVLMMFYFLVCGKFGAAQLKE